MGLNVGRWGDFELILTCFLVTNLIIAGMEILPKNGRTPSITEIFCN